MQRNLIVRQIRARPRLLIAIACAAVTAIVLPADVAAQPITRALVAWNVGTCVFLVLAAVMMARSSHDGMTRRAQREDEGQRVVLALGVVTVIASLAAIGGELVLVKDMRGAARAGHLALAALTVVSSWAFMHLIFALHYAHDFYAALARNHTPGLAFPGEKKPVYGDFFYFAAIIGTSGQTADVSLVTSASRRLGTIHCIVSFFFNTIVLALTINIAATLL
jgi:uncharacterized membrane protein